MRSFDYQITVEHLADPIGGVLPFVAKLAYFYERTASGEVPVESGIGESWGRTEDQARAKLRARVEEWIAEHCSGD